MLFLVLLMTHVYPLMLSDRKKNIIEIDHYFVAHILYNSGSTRKQ